MLNQHLLSAYIALYRKLTEEIWSGTKDQKRDQKWDNIAAVCAKEGAVDPRYRSWGTFVRPRKKLQKRVEEYVSCKGGTDNSGLAHGLGKIVYADGVTCTGGYRHGFFDGNGTITWPDGNSYQGPCWEKTPGTGHGVFTFADGGTYNGCLEKGMENGYGVRTYSDGSKYEGGWVDGFKEGIGTQLYSNGDKYIGEWKRGKQEGYGEMRYADGTVYSGLWFLSKRDGKGTMLWPTGERFLGNWLLDSREGEGTLRDKVGRILYEGRWENDTMKTTGKVRHVFSDGKIYYGDLVDGRRKGTGICIYPKGGEMKSYI
ncbi:hypothetical protein AGMMS49949_00680 [Alphaproteobacteria bacterium]|nr:hypothetical protein AGMMS49949_00680 [Alphaproteobacteria bacterium]